MSEASTNPIKKKIKSLSLTYRPHNAQRHAIRTSTDPQAIADSIDDKIREFRELAERHYGPGVFEIDDLLACITLNVPGTIDDEKANPSRLLSNLSNERIFELGQRVSSDTVATLYRDILGRWPEAEGREHYEGQLAAGRPRWEIVREIELSEEALSKAKGGKP